MRSIRNKTGFVLPLALLAAFCVAFFMFTVFQLSQSNRHQVQHTNQHQISFMIGYSAYSTVLSRVYEKSWSERICKDAPAKYYGILFNGRYDIYVQDSPGKINMFDTYVRVKYADITKLFFWRTEKLDDILDIAGNFKTIWYTEFPVDDSPLSAIASSFASQVDDLIEKRAENRGMADETALKLSELDNIIDIVDIIAARRPEHPDEYVVTIPDKNFEVAILPEYPTVEIPANPEPVDQNLIPDLSDYVEDESFLDPLPLPPTPPSANPGEPPPGASQPTNLKWPPPKYPDRCTKFWACTKKEGHAGSCYPGPCLKTPGCKSYNGHSGPCMFEQ